MELLKGWECCFRKRKERNQEAGGKPRQLSTKGQREVSHQAAHLHCRESEEDGNRAWSGGSWWPSHQRCGNGNHARSKMRSHNKDNEESSSGYPLSIYLAALNCILRECSLITKTEASQQEWGHLLFFSHPDTNPPACGPISYLMLWCRNGHLPRQSPLLWGWLLSPSQWPGLSGCSLCLWYCQGSFLISNKLSLLSSIMEKNPWPSNPWSYNPTTSSS